ncbi:6-carboxytetrahydropterin synthase [uncultured Odoribacter sp.]|uniref:6-pyruvoyl trahydropterin synthase family protein n=1 Tax=uncultured Odoribacter sp. TaxID=876416 RepID=UPI002624BE3C|nr:6-carboxytetrahydropterin synthase [uncultured Odoribacter sp.]
MIIRKLYKFEGAHIVRHCFSQQCRENIHGHSYVVEVFIRSDQLDHACMVMDFGLLDKVKMFIESFDHTYSLWAGESAEMKHFIYKFNRRVAEFPLSPSAEGFALLFLYVTDLILKNTRFKNGEGNVEVASVRVHETATGYAEAFREDLRLVHFPISAIHFSPAITEQWKTTDWWEKLMNA